MRRLWVAIDSKSDGTRVLATAGPKETVLKARLSAICHHPRAVPALLEALAMWEGMEVHAVVVADDVDSSSVTRLKLDWQAEFTGDPFYRLEFVDGRKRRHRDPLHGVGPSHDLRQLMMFEVAR